MSVRCFVAVECSSDKLATRFQEARRRLESTQGDVKFVEPENIHLTLKFLGEIEQSRVDEAVEAVKSTSFKPFTVMIEGVGAFPNLRRPRVVWAGITEGVTEFVEIWKSTDLRLSKLGFERERRGFSPHITIGRVRSGRNRDRLAEEIAALGDFEFGRLQVDRIKLKRSVLTPQGPIYSTLAESTQDQ
ncbi:RNA 2',3'-cyclic phosphodiesterase [Candidatus Bathyarchaeota archaeon]|nr:RNA 2',3'-cyclic phosphodiesterase [Candidatus Bathyarchaeota archaeon]